MNVKHIESKDVSDITPIGGRANQEGVDPRYKAAPSMSPRKAKTGPVCFTFGIAELRLPEMRTHEVTRHADGTQFIPTDGGYVQIDP